MVADHAYYSTPEFKLGEELGEAAYNCAVANGQSHMKDESDNIDMDKRSDSKRKRSSDPVMIISPDCMVNSDSSTACVDEIDSDSSSLDLPDNHDGGDTDDGCGAGLKEMWAFLYWHFTITIVLNEAPGN